MPWLKRNMFLVVGGLIALGLLGLAGYFLYAKINQNDQVTDQLNQSTEQLKTLVNRDPHPGAEGVDNIGAAKEEQKKLQAFLSDVRKHFPSVATNDLSNREFRVLLDNTIDTLQRSAERTGVSIPKDYWFTFAAQKTSMNFASGIIKPLTVQLGEVSALCDVLYNAKVVSMVGLKRVSVGSDDTGSTDYLSVKATTNDWATVTPYEVTFDGFSSELSEVLKGLIRSSNFFVVKNLAIQRAPDEASSHEAQPLPYSNPMSRYGMDRSMASRYGISAPRPVVPQPVARPAGRGGLTTVLEEKKLRFTLSIDSIKLKPAR
jgi:hypothetical protein